MYGAQRKKRTRVVEKKMSNPWQPLDPHAENSNECKLFRKGEQCATVPRGVIVRGNLFCYMYVITGDGKCGLHSCHVHVNPPVTDLKGALFCFSCAFSVFADFILSKAMGLVMSLWLHWFWPYFSKLSGLCLFLGHFACTQFFYLLFCQ